MGTMDSAIAPIVNIKFDIEVALEQQLGAQNLPFPGMDKSTAMVCTLFTKGQCQRASFCPYRHLRADRTIVCKHWLRGLCKKGDQCEFLHEFDMAKMPECYFYARFSACHNKECPFLHIDPETKIKDCPWYDRGFCRHGPTCRHRHVRRVLCMNYTAGFCPDGPECKFVHPRFELPPLPDDIKGDKRKMPLVCHFCGEVGHKAAQCPKIPSESKDIYRTPADASTHANNASQAQRDRTNLRPLDEVTCYRCGLRGHYANRCNKGHLAFLSNQPTEERS
uniref:Cleavage and polyadenylation specificity factor subunit 4 n=2 Tax=Daphnia TaxID=6668 RepID=A0A8J2RUF1_9CRUS|nr:unnamed protein product [Daphnia galeata]